MNNLDDAADLICNPDIREDRRDRLVADYASEWAVGELERHLDYPIPKTPANSSAASAS